MLAELAYACVLSMLGGHAPAAPACNTPYLNHIAHAIDSRRYYDVPQDIVVGVMYHESRFRQFVVSNKGAVGLMQNLRNGSIQGEWRNLSDEQLSDVDLSVEFGMSYLALMKRKCHRFYLSRYNGAKGGCVPSNYDSGIRAELRQAKLYVRILTGRCQRAERPERCALEWDRRDGALGKRHRHLVSVKELQGRSL